MAGSQRDLIDGAAGAAVSARAPVSILALLPGLFLLGLLLLISP